MREIKFRAWDKKYKRMIYDFPLVSHGEFNVFDFEFLKNWTTGFSPMQYAGLKDKNGKEIYEGDIVRYPDTRDKDVIDEVVWLFAGFDLRDYNHGESWDYGDTPWYQVEVIGNIYENPELLKRGDDVEK